jgi:hypothetical protein
MLRETADRTKSGFEMGIISSTGILPVQESLEWPMRAAPPLPRLFFHAASAVGGCLRGHGSNCGFNMAI